MFFAFLLPFPCHVFSLKSTYLHNRCILLAFPPEIMIPILLSPLYFRVYTPNNLLFMFIQTLKVRIWPGSVVMYTFNPRTPRQRHADLYEFGARLIHTASSRTTRESCTVRPCLKKRILKGIQV